MNTANKMNPEKKRDSALIMAALLCLAAWSCAQDPPGAGDDAMIPEKSQDAGPAHDPTEATFAPDHLLEVRVELDPAHWDKLRHDGRDYATMKGCLTGPPTFPWQRFTAQVTVDGVKLEQVEVRKKGFFGSLSVIRPSLKLVFDRHLTKQRFRGLERMTLNNNRQDSSQVRQCLAYGLFARAGLPAPRCNFARVWVNGQDLGIYTHVESIKKDFLRRHFSSAKGNLYEGQTADFTAGRVQTFELKTNEEQADRSDLQQVVQALKAEDHALEQALSQIIDLDQFLDFWILETLAAHWDSYSGNRNNFFIYHDPESDRFSFIPWGTDGSFRADGGFLPKERPQAVMAKSALAARLYNTPSFRARYLARVQVLLDTVWDEAALKAQIDQIKALLGEAVAPPILAQVLEVINARRGLIQAELDAGGEDWPEEATAGEACGGLTLEPVSGSFSTTWGNIGSKQQYGTAELELRYQGSLLNLEQTLSQAGYPEESDHFPVPPAIRLIAIAPGDQVLVIQFSVEPELFKSGQQIPFHGFATVGVFLAPPDDLIGFVSDGVLTLDQAAITDGAEVSGSFSGQLIY